MRRPVRGGAIDGPVPSMQANHGVGGIFETHMPFVAHWCRAEDRLNYGYCITAERGLLERGDLAISLST